MTRWSQEPLERELPRLLAERRLTLSALARQIGVSQSFVWNAVHRRRSKRASLDLIERIASELGIPADHFPEYRQAVVLRRLQEDGDLRDEIYRRISEGHPAPRSRVDR